MSASPRLITIDQSRERYCPGMSSRGWRYALARAHVDNQPVLVRIGQKRLFVVVERLEKWIQSAPGVWPGSSQPLTKVSAPPSVAADGGPPAPVLSDEQIKDALEKGAAERNAANAAAASAARGRMLR